MEVPSSSDLSIHLRPFKLSDADDFLLYGGDANVTEFTQYETFKTKEEAASFIQKECIPHPYCRSICLNDRSIGRLFIKPGTGDDQCRAKVGYMLAAKYWGQGIAAKAMKIAIVEALKEFPCVERMEAFADLGNNASVRVLEKIGFNRVDLRGTMCLLKVDILMFWFLDYCLLIPSFNQWL